MPPLSSARGAFVGGLFGALAVVLSGCALTGPAPTSPSMPSQWQATLPHGGDTAALATWWSQFDDPALTQLIDAAEQAHGSVAQAAARIGEARAAARAAGAAAWPTLTANGVMQRSLAVDTGKKVISNTASVGIDASWEIDLFGVNRNNTAAAVARADSAELSWHDARVSLAAEVGSTYVNLRACEALVDVYSQDHASQQRTAKLTTLKVDAGLEAPANGALVDAGAAESSNRRIAQQADCDVLVKSLVALTALPEDELRTRLAARGTASATTAARLPIPRGFAVPAIPATILAQRPDLSARNRDLAAASAEIGAARADRYPRVSLSGSIAAVGSWQGGDVARGKTWSIGPAVSLPLFDAGRRAANVDAALARYEEALTGYVQRARDAVREVEEGLVRLDSAARRETDAVRAAQGFRRFFEATQASWEIGAGSLLDLEEARRRLLTADANLIGVQREHLAAWVTLYKAVGGGWEPERAARGGPAAGAPPAAE